MLWLWFLIGFYAFGYVLSIRPLIHHMRPHDAFDGYFVLLAAIIWPMLAIGWLIARGNRR